MSRYRKIIETITAPDDFDTAAVRGFPCISMAGNNVLHIDSHQGILHYDKNELTARAKGMDISVLGENLIIVSFSRSHIRIKGVIESVNIRRHKK